MIKDEQLRREDSRVAKVRIGEHPSRVIGETARSPRGYFVRVTEVSFEGGGDRTRIELHQGDTFVRHLDLTGDLARQTAALLLL